MAQHNLDLYIDNKYPITSSKIQAIANNHSLIMESIINGYLHLHTQDIAAVIPHTTRPFFYVFDTLISDRLRDAPIKKEFKPPGTGKKGQASRLRWVETVCFLTPLSPSIFFCASDSTQCITG